MKNSQRVAPKIPDGMVDLLKNLAKSVLKEQPDNIYTFAAEYFENLVRQRDGSLDKGYLTFRKYDDDIPKANGVDAIVCPRCNCVYNPEKKDSEPGEEVASPKNDDDNASEMSVNGVAIKAVPRNGKSSKGQKNRQRLETIRSVSMDSANEEDVNSQLTSPKPNETAPEKPNEPASSVPNLVTLAAVGAEALSIIPETPHQEEMNNNESEAVPISPLNENTEMLVEPISSPTKTTTDDDIDSSTNETSVSEANTDRTVIEVAPLNTELKNDELIDATDEKSEKGDLETKSDEMNSNMPEEITTVVTTPKDDQTATNDDLVESMNMNNLNLDQVKQMDRLRTPESDSGLSEKSFNLTLQENEEVVATEVNEAKEDNFIDKTDKDDKSKFDEKDFDTKSKDDSGIVDFEETQNEPESIIQSELGQNVAEQAQNNEMEQEENNKNKNETIPVVTTELSTENKEDASNEKNSSEIESDVIIEQKDDIKNLEMGSRPSTGQLNKENIEKSTTSLEEQKPNDESDSVELKQTTEDTPSDNNQQDESKALNDAKSPEPTLEHHVPETTDTINTQEKSEQETAGTDKVSLSDSAIESDIKHPEISQMGNDENKIESALEMEDINPQKNISKTPSPLNKQDSVQSISSIYSVVNREIQQVYGQPGDQLDKLEAQKKSDEDLSDKAQAEAETVKCQDNTTPNSQLGEAVEKQHVTPIEENTNQESTDQENIQKQQPDVDNFDHEPTKQIENEDELQNVAAIIEVSSPDDDVKNNEPNAPEAAVVDEMIKNIPESNRPKTSDEKQYSVLIDNKLNEPDNKEQNDDQNDANETIQQGTECSPNRTSLQSSDQANQPIEEPNGQANQIDHAEQAKQLIEEPQTTLGTMEKTSEDEIQGTNDKHQIKSAESMKSVKSDQANQPNDEPLKSNDQANQPIEEPSKSNGQADQTDDVDPAKQLIEVPETVVEAMEKSSGDEIQGTNDKQHLKSAESMKSVKSDQTSQPFEEPSQSNGQADQTDDVDQTKQLIEEPETSVGANEKSPDDEIQETNDKQHPKSAESVKSVKSDQANQPIEEPLKSNDQAKQLIEEPETSVGANEKSPDDEIQETNDKQHPKSAESVKSVKSDQANQPIEEPLKSNDQADQIDHVDHVDQAKQLIEEPLKASDPANQPIEEPLKSNDQVKQLIEEPETAVGANEKSPEDEIQGTNDKQHLKSAESMKSVKSDQAYQPIEEPSQSNVQTDQIDDVDQAKQLIEEPETSIGAMEKSSEDRIQDTDNKQHPKSAESIKSVKSDKISSSSVEEANKSDESKPLEIEPSEQLIEQKTDESQPPSKPNSPDMKQVEKSDVNLGDPAKEKSIEQDQEQEQNDTNEPIIMKSDVESVENELENKQIDSDNISNKPNEEEETSWDNVSEKIAESVEELDANQIEATAPILTNNSDDKVLSNEINSTGNEEKLEPSKANQDKMTQFSSNEIEKDLTGMQNTDQITSVVEAGENDETIQNSNELVNDKIVEEKPQSGAKKDAQVFEEVQKDELNEPTDGVVEPTIKDIEKNMDNEPKMMESGANDDKVQPKEISKDEMDSKSVDSDQIVMSKDPLPTEELESKPDFDTEHDLYSTPPETGNDRTSVVDEQNTEINSTANTDDTSKEMMVESKDDLTQNNSTNETNLSNEKSPNTQSELNVIENANPKLTEPENSNLVDEVKENHATAFTDSKLIGANESTENTSTMPAEGVDETDITTKQNQTIQNSDESVSNDDAKRMNESNENAFLTNAENNELKSMIEQEENSHDYETKSYNDDIVSSELSASVKDEYEQAETEIVGDESVKDLDLSSNNDLEPNQTNESADSEQQITTLEIPPPIDNDSIESTPKQNQMQPDSLDMLVDSLDASLEPSGDADSLNIDSLEDKPRSGKSIDERTKDSAKSYRSEVTDYRDEKEAIKNNSDNVSLTSDQTDQTDQTFKNDTNTHDIDGEKSAKMLGDIVDNKCNTDTMNDQMKNELEVLRLAEKPVPMHTLSGIEEVDSPLSGRSHDVNVPEERSQMKQDKTNAKSQGVATDDEIDPEAVVESSIKNQSTNDEKKNADDRKTEKQTAAAAEYSKSAENSSALDTNTTTSISSIEQSNGTSLTVTEAPDDRRSEEILDGDVKNCVEYLKPISNDTPSSDLSDTDTTDKAEKAYTESGVDETSRDERDEVSEIENFDLSSCGEDSLEGMYYMIRKNEIIMDRHKQTGTKSCEEDKITFPEAATDDLEHAVREVSGKKIKLCSIGSMNSSTDEVVLKKLSSDSDEIQLHVIPNSEIDSSSDPKSCPLKEECTANESTDDEYMNPILDSMRKNEDYLNGMHAKALSVQPNRCNSQSDDQQHIETDTFNEHLMDDMVPGNIERKILASSVSEADSDYFEMPPTVSRLTKDDFNVSTAFEHMIRADSTTEDSDSTIESAATKIQAGARGFLARRRIRKSSAGTSASNEKGSSIGNAAIDNSLDNLIEQQELQEETAYSESFEDSSTHSKEMRNEQTMDSVDSEKILGITEVKVEQRPRDDVSATGYINDDRVPGISIQGTSEESTTAQRRLMLQRGDAMQRNDTPESSEQQQQQQQGDKENTNDDEHLAPNEHTNQNDENAENNVKTAKIETPTTNASKPIVIPLRALGPRQRSMPVQIDSQLIRVLPKHLKKRVKSANSTSTKNNIRPQLF